jgi:ribose 5-phosphate isomerase B
MGVVRIALGSDHAGVALKQVIAEHLERQGHVVRDLGTTDPSVSVDYPDYGAAVGRSVATGSSDFGVAICGTGIGISIAANKINGVRAALVNDVTTARLTREHNHANVICLGARVIGEQTALDAIDAFFEAVPQEGRHLNRLAKIAALDDAASLPIETKEV